jgi:nitrile hydratase subunit alpha
MAHDHDHDDQDDRMAFRVKALERVAVEKGLVDPATLDELIETYEKRIGPRNGAKVVAKAWTDPAFKDWLLRDATAAIASLGFTGRQGEDMVALENTPDVHNMVVCTLCSCYPWPVLGLPPVWYKSAPYRARAVADPRGVLRELGVELAEGVEVRIWDSTAELRYLVLPRRPPGTEGWSEEQLAGIVTRDAMIGVAAVNGAHDLGGVHGLGPIRREHEEPVFHRDWERRVFALNLALGLLGRWNIDMGRFYRENRHPVDYLSSTYYELWLKGLERIAVDKGLLTKAELEAGRALAPRDAQLTAADPARARQAITTGRSAKMAVALAPKFSVGDSVRVKNLHPATHTRMPRYCRGKTGTIHIDHGVFVYPDTNAAGQGPKPQHCYSVRFTARELWGSPAHSSVYIDLWDDYLDAA